MQLIEAHFRLSFRRHYTVSIRYKSHHSFEGIKVRTVNCYVETLGRNNVSVIRSSSTTGVISSSVRNAAVQVNGHRRDFRRLENGYTLRLRNFAFGGLRTAPCRQLSAVLSRLSAVDGTPNALT